MMRLSFFVIDRNMLRYLPILFTFFVANTVFAMSCPGNGSVIDQGDSLDAVLTRCGKPLQQTEYHRTIITTQRWDYYKDNNKLMVYFNNDQVSAVVIDDSKTNCQRILGSAEIVCNATTKLPVTTTTFCGGMINIKDNIARVLQLCGNAIQKTILEDKPVLITTLKYQATSPDTLVFQDHQLIDWQ